MRANQPFRKDEKAEIGIGTMIVFIAAVLVAAIAAGVLIDTSSKLQERSSRTGAEATEQVSGNYQVTSVLGRRDTSTSLNIMDVDFFLSVAPGAPNMDISQMKLHLRTTTKSKIFDHADAVPIANKFNVTELRDGDNSFKNTGSNPSWVVNGGDLVNLTIALDLSSAQLSTREQFSVLLIPEFGNPVELGLLTPASFGVSTKIVLK